MNKLLLMAVLAVLATIVGCNKEPEGQTIAPSTASAGSPTAGKGVTRGSTDFKP